MLGRIINKIKPKTKDAVLDPRLAEKILHSDLWEFFEKHVDVLGRKTDRYYGKKIPNDPIRRFFTEINAVNTGILTRESFVNSDFSEDEINTIFGNYKFIFGAPPNWFVKCMIWDFMCFRERARLVFLQHDKKTVAILGNVLAEKIYSHVYVDWGRAIREFWNQESTKNYHDYLLNKKQT